MPDNKAVGWRKKLHGSKQKDMLPLNTDGDDTTAVAEDSSDRRRQHGWRRTIHGSRPETPVTVAPTNLAEDSEDARSERSEVSTPRRNSKPKLARYTSLFSSFKESSKGPEFAEPWSDDAPPPFQPYVDPLNALRSIRSHMITASPIPLGHNSGLFRIFEDYGKVREEKENLETLLQDTFHDWETAKDQWNESEGRYEAEIRRLELLIARGTSGMTGRLIKARQGSVVDRRRRHRKTTSNDRFPPMYEFLSPNQLDSEIRLSSQRALLHRPTSPSGKMTALSKQFTNNKIDLAIGSLSNGNRRMTLSRKVQSELNLASMARMEASQSITNSVNSRFSGSIGDPLPDEMAEPTLALIESAVECDAFVALRELGKLVARRRGLNVDSFSEGLIMLLSKASEATHPGHSEEQNTQPALLSHASSSNGKPYVEGISTSRPALRRFQSQPQLSSDQHRRRHFSFEPGDDQLQELEEDIKLHEARNRDGDSSGTDTPSLGRLRNPKLELQLTDPKPSSHTLSVEFPKPSKIPSPMQTSGRVRRETSASSLQSIFARPNLDRRDSRSSILTVVRQSSGGSVRFDSTSMSSSSHNLRTADSSLPLKDPQGSLRFRNSVIALAAARTAEKMSVCKGDSPARNSSRSSTTAS
ncbi:uncharacterized protein K460DRAFT_342364 [Cucurbitaria berberidis CBS 394.84]|uniref:Uncharacterized protein n=1 Tax=Cucurbitaria berberidis CBS 394.84 TaxID=1168544 RepID=A0A9P4GD95_9PLEO|nr:uncharacterized protein K460DRAFT_342364 [Cucurbitaria berberidis CBS 394.84]KAF1843793.1 hypothetical protein K460DRAFT_342364 [Cucurbitaria berberidis CBS 394.84]